MNFGEALDLLKQGKKLSRDGWNGKGMWIILVPGTQHVVPSKGTPYYEAGILACDILPHIDMWTVNSEGRKAMLPGWLASQSDMLAEDWHVVN